MVTVNNYENDGVTVEVKEINFDDIPAFIRQKLETEEKRIDNGFADFYLALKILSTAKTFDDLEEGFKHLYQSVSKNCPRGLAYITEKINDIENSKALLLMDFKWLQLAVNYNFTVAVDFVDYYAKEVTKNPALSSGIYLLGNNKIPCNIEYAVTILNNGALVKNKLVIQLVNDIFNRWNIYNEIDVLKAELILSGNEIVNKDYLTGINYLNSALNSNSDTAKNYVIYLINSVNNSDSKNALILALVLNSAKNNLISHDIISSDSILIQALFKNAYDYFKNNKDDDLNILYGLAFCYEHGFGCRKNLTKARDVYKKIINNGYKYYEKNYNRLDILIEKRRKKRITIVENLIVFLIVVDMIVFDCKYLHPVSTFIKDACNYILNVIAELL